MKQHGFDKIKLLATNVLKRFKISKTATHVGLLEFSNEVSRLLQLDGLYDSEEIRKVIRNISPSGGDGMATDEMLEEAADKMFAVPAGGRADAAKVLVVVTDGKSTGKVPLKEAVKPVKDKGIRVYVVDIGDETDPQEIRDLTPSDKERKKAKTPGEAPGLSEELVDEIQKAVKKSKYTLMIYSMELII